MSFNVTCSEKTVDIALKEICVCAVLLLSSCQDTSSLLDLARIHNFSQTLFKKYWEGLLISLPLFMKVLHYFSFNFLLLISFFFFWFLFNSILT